MRILISGAGIAGPTLAYWLARYGMHPTIVEQAPSLRTGGYVIDFWGAGFEVARRMELLPELLESGYNIREVRVVDRDGRRVTGFPASAFTGAIGGGFTSLPRGDLASAIFRRLPNSVDAIFGDTVDSIEQTPGGALVTFRRAPARSFDLVVGADGLHSRVREVVFGQQRQFERYLGIKVAAFEVNGYEPRDELVYIMYSEVGQQVSRFAMRGGRTMFLFIFADPDPATPTNPDAQKAVLKARFGNSGWECRRILEALEPASDLYFDRVSQIDMAGSWTRGRVALLGDAAFCVSLLGGQGSALAMAAAYILAGQLKRSNGAHEAAFAEYERKFGFFAAMKQRAARRYMGTFAPKSKFSLFVRNQIMGLLSIRWVAALTAGRDFTDRITLPDY